MQKYKMCVKSIMDSEYVLWTYKIHCFITPINHIARKFYLLHIRVLTYIRLLKRIHTNFIQKLQAVINLVREIYYEQLFLSHDFDGC